MYVIKIEKDDSEETKRIKKQFIKLQKQFKKLEEEMEEAQRVTGDILVKNKFLIFALLVPINRLIGNIK